MLEDDCFGQEDSMIYGGFIPEDHSLIIFNVETTVEDLWLSTALLNRLKTPEAVLEVVRAAEAMQRAFCLPNTGRQCGECDNWNRRYRPGQQVIVSQADGDSFVSRTASPAFETPAGPHVLIEDHKHAVALSSVFPSSINSPECVQ